MQEMGGAAASAATMIAAAAALPPLPWDVFARILSLLPVPCLARLRSVCRSWRSLLSSPSVLSSLQLRHPRSSSAASEWWFLMEEGDVGRRRRLVAYSCSVTAGAETAFGVPRPAQALLHTAALSQSVVPGVGRALVASAAGLVAAVVAAAEGGGGAYDVVLCNPLVIAAEAVWTRLPRPKRLSEGLVSSCAIAMSAAAAGGGGTGYRVLLSDAKLRHLEFYDSAAGAWFSGADVRSAAYCATATYDHLLAADLLFYRKDEKVAAFDGGSNMWRSVTVPFPAGVSRGLLKAAVVVKGGGGILLVTGCFVSSRGGGFAVYELRRPRMRWAEVGRTVAEGVVGEGPCLLDCRVAAAEGCELLCISGAHFTLEMGSGGGVKAAAEIWPPLFYDLSRHRWFSSLLPLPPRLLCLFPFQPRFDTIP